MRAIKGIRVTSLAKMIQKINNFKNHLESLGYKVELRTSNKGDVSLDTDARPGYPPLNFWLGKEGMDPLVVLTSGWKGVKKASSIEQFSCLNDLNTIAVLCKICTGGNNTIFFSAAYIGDYNKNNFDFFLDNCINEIHISITNEKFKKLFLE